MPTVELEDQEWQQVMGLIANAPWRDANPLLMKIGNQLRARQQPSVADMVREQAVGNGKEATHE